MTKGAILPGHYLRGRGIWGATALVVLTACSNGRGSVSDPPSAPVTSNPPPTQPTPPPTPPPEPSPTPTPPPPPPPAEPPPASPGAAMAGYWKGRVTDREAQRTTGAIALIDHQGEAQLIVLGADEDDDAQFVLYGNLCCGERFDDEELPGKRFLNSRNEEADVRIEIDNGGLAGEFEFRRRDYSFDLAFSGEYSEAMTLQTLAGVYTQTSTPLLGLPATLTLSIDANGQLSGSHSNGCAFDGSVSIPNPARNMVRIQMEMRSCGSQLGSSGEWNGSYDGLGIFLRDAPSPSNPSQREDVLYQSWVGPTWFGPQPVGK